MFHVIEHLDELSMIPKIKEKTLQRIIIITPDKDANNPYWMEDHGSATEYDTHKQLYGINELKDLFGPEFELKHHRKINKSLAHLLFKPLTHTYNDILLAIFDKKRG